MLENTQNKTEISMKAEGEKKHSTEASELGIISYLR